MADYATFDRSTFPLITITFTGEKPTEETFQEYLDECYANYDKREPIALVFDATKAVNPGIGYQQKQGKWMKEHDELISTYCRGIAYVIPNPLIRNVLKLIFAIQNNAVPFKVFKNYEEGVNWAKGQMDGE